MRRMAWTAVLMAAVLAGCGTRTRVAQAPAPAGPPAAAGTATTIATTTSGAPDGERCAAVRASAQHRADSVLAIPTGFWRPAATDDTLLIQRARHSGVVAQVLIDTAGAPVMRTFRVLAADYPQFGEPAARMLEPMHFPAATENGCTVPSVLVLPFEFRLR